MRNYSATFLLTVGGKVSNPFSQFGDFMALELAQRPAVLESKGWITPYYPWQWAKPSTDGQVQSAERVQKRENLLDGNW